MTFWTIAHGIAELTGRQVKDWLDRVAVDPASVADVEELRRLAPAELKTTLSRDLELWQKRQRFCRKTLEGAVRQKETAGVSAIRDETRERTELPTTALMLVDPAGRSTSTGAPRETGRVEVSFAVVLGEEQVPLEVLREIEEISEKGRVVLPTTEAGQKRADRLAERLRAHGVAVGVDATPEGCVVTLAPRSRLLVVTRPEELRQRVREVRRLRQEMEREAIRQRKRPS